MVNTAAAGSCIAGLFVLAMVSLGLQLRDTEPLISEVAFSWSLSSSTTTPEEIIFTRSLAMTSKTELYYTEDESFIPGKGNTKYRYPTKTYGRSDALVVVGVLATAHRPLARNYVRQSWAKGRNNVFFLVAGNWTEELAQEFEEYNDMFWVDDVEAYRGITVKVIAWLAAAKKHLSDSFVVKADDDSYIRLFELEQMAIQQEGPLYLGHGCRDHEVIRDKKDAWFVSRKVYEPDRYPRYAYGGGYVLSPEVNACALDYLDARRDDDQVFPIEDAFVGLMVERGCNYKVECTNDNRFRTHSLDKKPSFDKWDIKHKIIVHQVKTEVHMNKLHRATCCSTESDPFLPDPVSCAEVSCPEQVQYVRVGGDSDLKEQRQ